MTPEASFFGDDLREFGSLDGVTVHDITKLSPDEISGIVQGPGTTIGAFCNSGACLAPYQ